MDLVFPRRNHSQLDFQTLDGASRGPYDAAQLLLTLRENRHWPSRGLCDAVCLGLRTLQRRWEIIFV
jgi:hypothetical protein